MALETSFSKGFAVVMALALAGSVVVLSPTKADAWVSQGCRWSGTTPLIRYYRGGSLNDYWNGRAYTAALNWNAGWNGIDAEIDFQLNASGYQFLVTQGYFAWGNYAQWAYWCSGGFYSSSPMPELQVNLNYASSSDADIGVNNVLLTHEFGHSAGLGHDFSAYSCGPSATVMYGNDWGWVYKNCLGSLPPYENDVNGTRSFY
jgi:hypothetical protein